MNQVQLVEAVESSARVQEREATGQCNFPIWAALNPALHIRICGNLLESGVPVEETK